MEQGDHDQELPGSHARAVRGRLCGDQDGQQIRTPGMETGARPTIEMQGGAPASRATGWPDRRSDRCCRYGSAPRQHSIRLRHEHQCKGRWRHDADGQRATAGNGSSQRRSPSSELYDVRRCGRTAVAAKCECTRRSHRMRQGGGLPQSSLAATPAKDRLIKCSSRPRRNKSTCME